MKVRAAFERLLSEAKESQAAAKAKQPEPLTFVKGALTSFSETERALRGRKAKNMSVASCPWAVDGTPAVFAKGKAIAHYVSLA